MDPAPLTDPVFYAIAVPSLLAVGIAKGGFGGGVGLIGVPLLALAVPLVQAAAIMLPILCLMDVFALWAYRHDWSRAHVRALLPPALVGIAVGGFAFSVLDEAGIRGIVGIVAIAFSTQYWVGLWRRGGVERPPTRPRSYQEVMWGALSGFTSTVAHAGGPPMSVYLLPLRLAPSTYVGTSVVLFFAINYAKLVPYAWLGQLHAGNLLTSLLLAPVAPLGIWLGRWLHARVDETLFYRICWALLLVAGAKLVWDGLV